VADVFTPQKRAEVMSRIRGSGNRSTEQRMIALMREAKLTGWRRKSSLVGKPDFVFVRNQR
jgi:DNA mismatch endonuclease (patch repair protein)